MKRDNILFLSGLGFDIGKIQRVLDENINISKVDKKTLDKLRYFSKDEREYIGRYINSSFLDDFKGKLKEDRIRALTIYDEDYPINLRHINKSPLIIYTRGKIYRNEFQIAVIGSRNPTRYGIWACGEICDLILSKNITITSGLARGIDRCGHRKAISRNKRTIGVLGCGIDVVYPKENIDLYREMENKGGIISEFPLKTKPFPYNFPRRNRIISAMSHIVIVVEAKEKSGTLITSNFALEQGKDVLSLCGNINSELSKGTNSLIKKGAYPITSLDDLSEYLDTFKLLEVSLD